MKEKIIKTYKQFESAPLLLPPHKSEDKDLNDKIVINLDKIYDLDHKNIISTANRIKAIIDTGFYMRVKHVGTSIQLISQNEPCEIIGINKGRTISIGDNIGVPIDEDSIIIHVKVDDSLYILSVKESYELTFIRPKKIISQHDPYGEEDWGEE